MHFPTLASFTLLSLPLALSHPTTFNTTTTTINTTQLYTFPTTTDIENAAIRPNGDLLLTLITLPHLYTLSPSSSSSNHTAHLIATFPNSTALTGITPISHDKYAITGGVRGSYHYSNETIYTIDFSSSIPPQRDHQSRSASPRRNHAERPNLPPQTPNHNPSRGFKNEALAAPVNATMPIGINGLKARGEYVYFTNTARGTFARVRVSEEGDVVGEVEVIARLESGEDGWVWDDFDFGEKGEVYITQASDVGGAVARVDVDGDGRVEVVGPIKVMKDLSKDLINRLY
ncbi:hypothetical protein BO78DRAFT_467751 [Aspergillus sclerotiicarbonarius CBS 121057]|uniref:Uncharacterized protein n=1 Tax=Aspergillus sclerotiicarbonarius (strain CBS 121057 / IBT 28362) TaxID=1448318 RepID=A0A319F2M4_ASPSB|nr:hypothetical protein BO78DRAFT_467751 [Aspergillus sclerotiicarbonarius CBS 121057]